MTPLGDADYARLLEFRTELRRFVRFSEAAARETGLTPALHQLLLAVRGHRADGPPTVGDLADVLLVRHHTAVELAQRAEQAGLIARHRDDADHRRVQLELTPAGAAKLEDLSGRHLEALAAVARRLGELSRG